MLKNENLRFPTLRPLQVIPLARSVDEHIYPYFPTTWSRDLLCVRNELIILLKVWYILPFLNKYINH